MLWSRARDAQQGSRREGGDQFFYPWIAVIVVSSILVWGSVPVSGIVFRSDCAAVEGCQSCLNATGCVWCPSTNNCTANATDCEGFMQHQCPNEDQCVDLVGCEECASNPSCGWCDNQICLLGNFSGPTEGKCQDWDFRSQRCNAISCPQYVDCFSCLDAAVGCKWCNTTGQCRPLQDTRRDQCPEWLVDSCSNSGEVVACDTHTECSGCVGDESDQCGWCSSSKKCINKSDSDRCTDYKEKICSDTCADLSSNCTVCTNRDGCGWCNDQLCVAGNTTRAFYDNCNVWAYSSCSGGGDKCGTFNSCLDCVNGDRGECGWCDNGMESSCMVGSAEGGSNCSTTWWWRECSAFVFHCGTASSCADCVELANCEWCPDSNLCLNSLYASSSTCAGICAVPMPMATKILIGVASFCGAVLLGAGVATWYKVYWKRRHYYERLR